MSSSDHTQVSLGNETLDKVKNYLSEIGFKDVNFDAEKKVFLFSIVAKNDQTGQESKYPVGIAMVGDFVGLEVAVADLKEAPGHLSREKILEGLLTANFAWPEVNYALSGDIIVSVTWSHKDVLDGQNFATEFGRAVFGAKNFGSIVKYAAASANHPPKTFTPIYQ